jgi:diguanylate cyclase (GGDEF)-like protein
MPANKSFFISLKVKAAFFVTLLIISSTSLLLFLSLNQLEQQFTAIQTTKKSRLIDDFANLSDQSFSQLALIAEQIAITRTNSRSEEEFKIVLDRLWEGLEYISDISNIHFYNNKQILPVNSYGGETDEIFNQLANEAINSGRPENKVLCHSLCNFVAAIPIIVNDDIQATVVTKPLSDVIMALAKLNQVSVVLVTHQNKENLYKDRSLKAWNANVEFTTDMTKTFNILNDVSKRFTLEAVKNDKIQWEVDSANFIVSILPSVGGLGNEYDLIILDDITKYQETIKDHKTEAFIIIFISSLFFAVLAFLLTISPISKLQQLISQYAEIAKHEFTNARKGILIKKTLFPDELDVLFKKTIDLVDELDALNNDLSEKNHALHHQAMHDELTGLGNRNFFISQIQHTISATKNQPTLWALVFIDLDNFKVINDNFGHDSGDQVLKTIAQRLVNCLHQTDIISRLGGDEFTLILKEINTPEDISKIMDKLFHNLQQPMSFANKEITMNCSAGVLISNENIMDYHDALKSADIAMYEAKKAGRNCYKVFNKSMYLYSQHNFMIQHEFNDSLQNNEFYLQLQPQVVISTGKLIGFEALVRWKHHELGPIYPDSFIPILDGSDKIVQLGRWVAINALAQLAELSEYVDSLRMAINVSPRQLHDETFIPLLLQLCELHNIKTQQIEIELTEGILVENIELAKLWMHKVIGYGFHLAIDDFGTGYSSLSYLSNLPFNTVKLDRSFITPLTDSDSDRDLLEAIIHMVKKMKCEVVAEGIEDSNQYSILGKMNCHIAQGYLIQRPIEVSELKPILKEYAKTACWPSIANLVDPKRFD